MMDAKYYLLEQRRIVLEADEKLVTQLTHGDWEVENINGVDDASGTVYFTANEGDWRQAN